MSAYLTPGVYLRPNPAERKDLRLVRTDVAGFLGFAERGPLLLGNQQPSGGKLKPEDFAVRLTSFKEFTAVFGGFIRYGSLAYAVRAFFENGGTTCYVVRVASTTDPDLLSRPRVASLAVPDGSPAVRVATLASASAKGANVLNLGDKSKLVEGDLIAAVNNGLMEFAMVIGPATKDNIITVGHSLLSPFPAGTDIYKYSKALVVRATSAGSWGNRVRLDFTQLQDGSGGDEFSLRVSVENASDASQPKEVQFFKRLSLKKSSPRGRNSIYAPDVINGQMQFIQVEASSSASRLGLESTNQLDAGPLSEGPVYLEGGRDGLANVSPADFIGGLDDFRGLRILEDIDEVSIVCAPDAVTAQPNAKIAPPPEKRNRCDPPPKQPPSDPVEDDPTAVPPAFDDGAVLKIYWAMIEHCERLRDRVAVLDSPASKNKTADLVKWRSWLNTRFAALYYPWLKVPDPINPNGLSRAVPPCGHVAGAYAQIDNKFGVHRPPANLALEFVTDVAEEVSALVQEELNPYDVNAIRSFNGRGIRIWGARSLADPSDSDWRFIHARRLMSMIEESVFKSMQWTVFEPNDFSLRRTLVHSLSVFLEAIWRQGGLKGAVPAEGFYVKCDETNNPPPVIDAGQLICEVGIAIAAPMEFIVFEIRQAAASAQIVEA